MRAKIDIVYTWVDGSDVLWRSKRSEAARENKDARLIETANVEGRFRDNGELWYSLRALEAYFPDHGQIFLVTDNQKPAWIGQFPCVTVIDHTDILDPDGLPTFSSMNIEACLHRIDGLSEYYLYFNDDVFLCRNVTEEDFFSGNGVIFNASETEVPENAEGSERYTDIQAAAQSIKWLGSQGYSKIVRNLPGHAPMPVIKSTMIEMEQVFPGLFRKARREKFRCRGSFSLLSDLYYRWMIATGRGQVVVGSSVYFETGSPDFERSLRAFEKRSRNSPVFSFCINDTHDNATPEEMAPAIALMQQFCAASIPVVSPRRISQYLIAISDIVGYNCSDISLDTPLSQICRDRISRASVLAAAEKIFGVNIRKGAHDNLETIQDVLDLVCENVISQRGVGA